MGRLSGSVRKGAVHPEHSQGKEQVDPARPRKVATVSVLMAAR